ncbi:hypothetical protein Tco_0217653 [Tanacetum coccineum]
MGHISEAGLHELEKREVFGNKGLGGFEFTFLDTRMRRSASSRSGRSWWKTKQVENQTVSGLVYGGRDEFFKKNHTVSWSSTTGQLVSCSGFYKIKEGIEGVQKTRVIISLTACEDYELEQHDVKTAFLHGSLMYLMVYPRPDITYAVSIVSRYLANPGKNHWEVVKWILKYSKGTADVGLVYGRDQGKHIVVDGFVNADYAKDPDKDRSIPGVILVMVSCYFFPPQMSWKATLQHVVAVSTTNAEYLMLKEM